MYIGSCSFKKPFLKNACCTRKTSTKFKNKCVIVRQMEKIIGNSIALMNISFILKTLIFKYQNGVNNSIAINVDLIYFGNSRNSLTVDIF